ncbi:aspartate aminotransferase family protein [Acidisoma cellulosilytica]|uniref:Aspartate aminotransferase family protein n=1 Tax=Acidisoma cellulosilyticum TaxID=2802395 RepID=A0A963Z7P4_9PROT|nr:aspartate aminotransferase family protein [Acidisoma cellulosilyticum]MCB8883392.1 aspartate aminotransferase family protein [Acidisoma cellulosilyticum]
MTGPVRAAAVRAGEGDVNHSPRRQDWAARQIQGASRDLIDRDASAFLHQSVSSPCLNAIARAEGIWIEDVAGRRYMDFHGNNVHHIGYGHPRLKAAIAAQMDALPFAPRRFTCEPAVALAEKLAEIAPGDLSKVLFTTGGSDAIEVALKVARAATGRFKTISFWDAFHGAGFGASSVGGEAMFRSGPIGPLLPGTEHVAPFACYHCPYGYPAPNGLPDLDLCHMTCANYLRYVLEREGDVAAVIAEPARAVPYLPPPGYWKAVAEACRAHGTLLIFDEIPTGLGKTGRMFACDHDGVTPDILVMGKALGGGILPIAAVLCRPDLDVAGAYAFGHYTHEKNPVTARAALTTIQIIEDEDLVENARRVGDVALDRLHAMKAKHPLIGDVRGRGFLLGIELVTDRAAKTAASNAAEAILYRAFDQGLSFKTTMGNVLTLTPSLITTEDQMMRALDILEACIAAEENGAAGAPLSAG